MDGGEARNETVNLLPADMSYLLSASFRFINIFSSASSILKVSFQSFHATRGDLSLKGATDKRANSIFS